MLALIQYEEFVAMMTWGYVLETIRTEWKTGGFCLTIMLAAIIAIARKEDLELQCEWRKIESHYGMLTLFKEHPAVLTIDRKCQ